MIDYKQLASDLIAIQADAVSRNKELLGRARNKELLEKGGRIELWGEKQFFDKDVRRNFPREDRDLYGQAARDAELGRKVRNLVKDRPRVENLLTDNMYKAYAFDLIAKEAGK